MDFIFQFKDRWDDQELTKASWPGSERAWDKTGLAEHSGQ